MTAAARSNKAIISAQTVWALRAKLLRANRFAKPTWFFYGSDLDLKHSQLADCVSSSSPLILRKFPGFSGIWGEFGEIRENSGEFSGIQWGFVLRLV